MSNQISIKAKSNKILAISSLALTLLLTGCSASSSSSDSTPQVAEPMGGYCVSISDFVDQSFAAMAGAGDYRTLQEIGDFLQSFDSSMVGSQSNADLLYSAGNDLLRVRVDLGKGIDKEADRAAFLAKARKIDSICGAD